MGIMGSRLRSGWVLAVIGAFALVGACSLNAQPIPPGVTDGTDQGNDASTPSNTVGGGADGSGGDANDAQAFPPDDDGGDASDSGEQDAADSGDT